MSILSLENSIFLVHQKTRHKKLIQNFPFIIYDLSICANINGMYVWFSFECFEFD